ncbi:class I SAM-dependent methyltransferase [Catellatospora tritici]|uniref:class I SAM-dependent methyltransferase n=1 Tax=Catellatospora tritici TaxID=2851566 RepID=UPI001C2DB2DB|nr:class I SAM-dependent methyltransferase [Catellatospora tritici]MBV1849555.1 class I SAM-dependent methyltransferase [Catellatospora tritici]
MNPPLPFDTIAPVYDQTRNSLEGRRHLSVDVESWLVAGMTLDVGVGTGLIGGALRERGHPVCGVDISLPMLRRARERLGDSLVCGDACALPFASGVMGNAVFVASLHTIVDVPGAIHEAARVLRPGGRLIATYGDPSIEPVAGPTDDIMETFAPLEELEAFQRPDARAVLDSAAHEAGLTAIHHGTTEKTLRHTAPAWLAQQLEDRTFSVLWHVDEDSWNRVVRPVIRNLRALPDPDRPRLRHHGHYIVVYER